MQEKYEALITKSFTDGQAIADIIKGNFYDADKEQEYFINEYQETIYLPIEKFDEYFRKVKIKSYQQKAKKKYRKENSVAFYMVFNPKTDQDIIDKLESVKDTLENKIATKGSRAGKSEYIRRLIREDIKRETKGGN